MFTFSGPYASSWTEFESGIHLRVQQCDLGYR